MKNVNLIEKYNLPEKVEIEIIQTEGIYFIKFLELDIFAESEPTISNLILIVTDAILTHHNVSKNDWNKMDITYIPTDEKGKHKEATVFNAVKFTELYLSKRTDDAHIKIDFQITSNTPPSAFEHC